MTKPAKSEDFVIASEEEETIFLNTISKRFNQFFIAARSQDNDEQSIQDLERWTGDTKRKVIEVFRRWYSLEVKGKRIPSNVTIPKPRQDRIYKSFSKSFKDLSCEICGDTRVLNIAHIIPRSDGGPDEEWNLMRLCANHHYLFDEHKLSQEEWARIDWTSKDKRARKYIESHQLRMQQLAWGVKS